MKKLRFFAVMSSMFVTLLASCSSVGLGLGQSKETIILKRFENGRVTLEQATLVTSRQPNLFGPATEEYIIVDSSGNELMPNELETIDEAIYHNSGEWKVLAKATITSIVTRRGVDPTSVANVFFRTIADMAHHLIPQNYARTMWLNDPRRDTQTHNWIGTCSGNRIEFEYDIVYLGRLDPKYWFRLIPRFQGNTLAGESLFVLLYDGDARTNNVFELRINNLTGNDIWYGLENVNSYLSDPQIAVFEESRGNVVCAYANAIQSAELGFNEQGGLSTEEPLDPIVEPEETTLPPEIQACVDLDLALKPGDRVLATGHLHVRAWPSYSSTATVGEVFEGDTGSVGNPDCLTQQGEIWWYVEFDNGVSGYVDERALTLASGDSNYSDLDTFKESLKYALENADYDLLEELVPQFFYVGPHTSEYTVWPHEGWMNHLRLELRAGDVTVDLSSRGDEIANQLGLNPMTDVETYVYVESEIWEKALLGITWQDGRYYWREMVTHILLIEPASSSEYSDRDTFASALKEALETNNVSLLTDLIDGQISYMLAETDYGESYTAAEFFDDYLEFTEIKVDISDQGNRINERLAELWGGSWSNGPVFFLEFLNTNADCEPIALLMVSFREGRYFLDQVVETIYDRNLEFCSAN